MKKTILFAALAGFFAANLSCRKIEVDGNTTTTNTGGGGGTTTENTILTGRITADRTLKAAYTYTLRDLVYVTNGATLTIEPGTKIVGEKNTRGALIITRGSKIIANGTAAAPIVFTSDQANPQRGDWAGIVPWAGPAPMPVTMAHPDWVKPKEVSIMATDWVYLAVPMITTTAEACSMCASNMPVTLTCPIKS